MLVDVTAPAARENNENVKVFRLFPLSSTLHWSILDTTAQHAAPPLHICQRCRRQKAPSKAVLHMCQQYWHRMHWDGVPSLQSYMLFWPVFSPHKCISGPLA